MNVRKKWGESDNLSSPLSVVVVFFEFLLELCFCLQPEGLVPFRFFRGVSKKPEWMEIKKV